LLNDLPTRPRALKSDKAAVWVKKDHSTVAVTCTNCLRTFPVDQISQGLNQVECDFCASTVNFEIITALAAN
jgi:hypothetical protein